MSGPALELSGVTRRFGDRLALDDVSFAVPPGQVVGLLGPNGAGKTTAMRIVFGVTEPDAGEIRFEGRVPTRAERTHWGYMPQERGLYPDMRVGDQVTYFARLIGLDRTAARRRTSALLAELRIDDRAGDRVSTLSGGQQQVVQLAVTLVQEPPVVVLDEPFAGLDPVRVDELSGLVRRLAAEGRTVVFSSHQLDLVEGICESIVMIDRGRVVLDGKVPELKAASGRRALRVHVQSERVWYADIPGVEVIWTGSTGVRLMLAPDIDALAVLDAARAAGPVRDFGLEQPSLTELFLDAVDRQEFETAGANS